LNFGFRYIGLHHVIAHRRPNAICKTHVFAGLPWFVLGVAIAFDQACCRWRRIQIAPLHGGSFVSQANYMAVIVGAVLSIVFFGQPFKWAIVLGIILLMTSLWLSIRKIKGNA
jgi:drug/metabolite transporter (DMT)-like permease